MKYYSSNAKKIKNWKFIQTKQILDEILTETKKNFERVSRKHEETEKNATTKKNWKMKYKTEQDKH